MADMPLPTTKATASGAKTPKSATAPANSRNQVVFPSDVIKLNMVL